MVGGRNLYFGEIHWPSINYQYNYVMGSFFENYFWGFFIKEVVDHFRV